MVQNNIGIQILLIGNTFQKLNFLKNGVTDAATERKLSKINTVGREYMQHYGLVLDIFNGGTRYSSIYIAKNTFKENLFFYRNEMPYQNIIYSQICYR